MLKQISEITYKLSVQTIDWSEIVTVILQYLKLNNCLQKKKLKLVQKISTQRIHKSYISNVYIKGIWH